MLKPDAYSLGRIDEAIRSYKSRSPATRFDEGILETLQDSDVQLCSEIMECALKDDHWMKSKNIQDGIAAAKADLKKNYAGLSQDAVGHIVNYAAYCWK